jgi:hypothetical protein
LLSSNAYAWFFFFLPGAVTGKIADAFTGAEGENCVGIAAKVGDNIRLENGDVKSITSLSGTSTRCTNPELPIRALLGNATTSPPAHISKAGIDLPDAWTPQTLTDALKAENALLHAANRNTDTWLVLSAMSHKGITDMKAFATARRSALANMLTEAQVSEISQSMKNGVPAWQYTVSGKLKNGTDVTYLMTIFDTDGEIVALNTWTTTTGFAGQKVAMEGLSTRISGLAAPTTVAVVLPAQSVPQASQPAAVATPPATTTTSAPTQSTMSETAPKSQGSIASRLGNLKKLYEEGLITEEEYAVKRKEILGTL